jgi:hypothetical protein
MNPSLKFNVVVLITVLTLAASAATAVAGEGTITTVTFGATSKEVSGKVTRYAIDKDGAAILQLVQRGLVILLQPGQRVYLVETALFSGLVKVRLKGSTDEVWIPIEHYKRD